MLLIDLNLFVIIVNIARGERGELVVHRTPAVDEMAVRVINNVVHEIFTANKFSFLSENIQCVVSQILGLGILGALICSHGKLHKLLVAVCQVVHRRREILLFIDLLIHISRIVIPALIFLAGRLVIKVKGI